MTTREDLVIDASALVALLIDGGEDGEWVAERIQSARIHAPDHILIETMNVIRKQLIRGALTAAEAQAAVAGMDELPISLWPWSSTSVRTWELGANLSSYDAAYAALAEQIGGPLISLDRRLSRAPGVRCAIESPLE